MGTARALLCVFAGCFVAARALISDDGAFPRRLPRFFEDLFLFERNFNFPRYDTALSSGQSLTPDFHVLGELPFGGGVPGVEVFCDESKLLVLVGKRASGVVLTADDLRLGDSCLSNQDLPNQHVFAYRVDECGTTRVVSGFNSSRRFPDNFGFRPGCVAGGKWRRGGLHQHTLDKADKSPDMVAASFLGAPHLRPQKVSMVK